MVFLKKTIHVIQKFYKNNKCKVIVNGFLSKTFNIENGIRQGCPLSALLYINQLLFSVPAARQMEGFVLPNNSEVKLTLLAVVTYSSPTGVTREKTRE